MFPKGWFTTVESKKNSIQKIQDEFKVNPSWALMSGIRLLLPQIIWTRFAESVFWLLSEKKQPWDSHSSRVWHFSPIMTSQPVFHSTTSSWRKPQKYWSVWCSTPNRLLICSSFSRKNGHPSLICSLLCTTQCMVDVPLAMVFYVSEGHFLLISFCILKTCGAFKIFFERKKGDPMRKKLYKDSSNLLVVWCLEKVPNIFSHMVGHDGNVHPMVLSPWKTSPKNTSIIGAPW